MSLSIRLDVFTVSEEKMFKVSYVGTHGKLTLHPDGHAV